MNEDYIYDDFLTDIPFTRYVGISGEGLKNAIIDAGFDAVIKIYEMAEKNEIPYVESVKLDYCANCDLKFKGKNLLIFLKEYYPDQLQKFEDKVNPDSDYILSCIDFS